MFNCKINIVISCSIIKILIVAIASYDDGYLIACEGTLQKLKYDIHTKLPLESYQNQFWHDSSGNLV